MARQFAQRARSRTRWTLAANAFSAQGAGTAAVNVLTAINLEETIIRMWGNLLASIDGASAPGKLVRIGVGMIVMPEGTGTTVTSSPISDAQAPWFYYSAFDLGYEEMVTDVIDVPVISAFRETIDVKAMRIIRPDREL